MLSVFLKTVWLLGRLKNSSNKSVAGCLVLGASLRSETELEAESLRASDLATQEPEYSIQMKS